MNKCEKFKDLILTDYVDGELDLGWQAQVEGHVQECADCRAFAEEVRRGLIAPFQQTVAEPAPEHLWASIKERIEDQKRSIHPSASFIDRLIASLSFLRPTPVFMSLIVIIFVGTLIFRSQQIKQAKEKDQNEEFAYILGTVDVLSEADEEIGTPIETYFL